jgi:hypothetical protein
MFDIVLAIQQKLVSASRSVYIDPLENFQLPHSSIHAARFVEFQGIKRWYLLGGAFTVLIIAIAYGVPAIIVLIRDFANDWINIIIAS